MDDYEITIAATWRYKDHKRGPQVVEAGTYRVPGQMKAAVARMAIEAGAGVHGPVSNAGDQPSLEAAASEPVETGTGKGKTKRTRKTRAPANKALFGAPEDKTSLV